MIDKEADFGTVMGKCSLITATVIDLNLMLFRISG